MPFMEESRRDAMGNHVDPVGRLPAPPEREGPVDSIEQQQAVGRARRQRHLGEAGRRIPDSPRPRL
jgi:hypothetical protein